MSLPALRSLLLMLVPRLSWLAVCVLVAACGYQFSGWVLPQAWLVGGMALGLLLMVLAAVMAALRAAMKPVAMKPETAKPETAKPVVTNPVMVNPSVMSPAMMSPSVMNPATVASAAMASMALAAAVKPERGASGVRTRAAGMLTHGLHHLGVLLLAAVWVAHSIHDGLQSRLAPSLEDVPLQVLGTVASLPVRQGAGDRVLFAVQRCVSLSGEDGHGVDGQGCGGLRQISLSWSAPRDGGWHADTQARVLNRSHVAQVVKHDGFVRRDHAAGGAQASETEEKAEQEAGGEAEGEAEGEAGGVVKRAADAGRGVEGSPDAGWDDVWPEPGQRWQLVVKLRRPVAAVNPGAFDTELRMLQDGIDASGRVVQRHRLGYPPRLQGSGRRAVPERTGGTGGGAVLRAPGDAVHRLGEVAVAGEVASTGEAASVGEPVGEAAGEVVGEVVGEAASAADWGSVHAPDFPDHAGLADHIMVWVQSLRAQLRQHLETLQANIDPQRGGDAERWALLGIVTGLSLGDQAAMGADAWGLFSRTGVSHLMAISGMHVTLLALVVSGLCLRLHQAVAMRAKGRRLQRLMRVPRPWVVLVPGVLTAFGYALLSGWGVPSQRTCFMLLAAAVLRAGGRSPSALMPVLLAAAAIIALDPWAVAQAGFWLSFCAVLALMWCAQGSGGHAGETVMAGMAGAPGASGHAGSEAGSEAGSGTEPGSGLGADDGAGTDHGFAADDGVHADDGRGADGVSGAGEGAAAYRESSTVSGAGNDAVPSAAARLPGQRIRAWFAGARVQGWLQGLREGARNQWAATVLLTPLTIAFFSTWSLIGPVANVVAIPWVGLVLTPMAIGVMLLAPWWPWLAGWILKLLLVQLGWLMQMLRTLDALPMASIQLPQPGAAVLGCALLGAVLILAPRGLRRVRLGLLCLLPMALAPAQPAPDDALVVTALDIGQGSMVLIEQGERRLLFDTGPSRMGGRSALEGTLLPWLHGRGLQDIDGLVVSHLDARHAGGTRAAMARLRPRWWMMPMNPRLLGLEAVSAGFVPCLAGQTVQWGQAVIEVLNPERLAGTANAAKQDRQSCVIRVRSPAGSVLLPGDLPLTAEAALVKAQGGRLAADVLVLPQDGSRKGSGDRLLEAVSPALAILQTRYRNHQQQPHAEVLMRLKRHDIRLLRTDWHGAVQVVLRAGTAPQVIRSRIDGAPYWRIHAGHAEDGAG